VVFKNPVDKPRLPLSYGQEIIKISV